MKQSYFTTEDSLLYGHFDPQQEVYSLLPSRVGDERAHKKMKLRSCLYSVNNKARANPCELRGVAALRDREKYPSL